MLTLPPKFKQALGNGTRTSLYPLVRIYKGYQIDENIPNNAEAINLSIKETTIKNLDDTYESYIPLLLNSPSISSKADIINNKYTISSVSLSISNAPYNGKIFSDDIPSLLNAVVQVYYAANGLDSLEDCLLVYTGTIRRYNQSAETLNLTLEDLTEQKLKTQIPSTLIEDQENFYDKESRGPVLPSPEDPINPFAPKPTGPVLPDKMMAAKGGRIGYSEGSWEAEWDMLYNDYKAKQIELGKEFVSKEEFIDMHRDNNAQGGRIGYYTGGQSIPSEYTVEDARKTAMQDKLGGITDIMKKADLYRQGDIGQMYMADGGIMRVPLAYGMSPGEAQARGLGAESHGRDFGGKDETAHRNIHAGMTSPSMTTAGTLSDPREKQDYFTQTYSGQPNFLGFGGGYRNLRTPNDARSGYKSRLNPMGLMSLLGKYMKHPFTLAATGINALRNKFGPAWTDWTDSGNLAEFLNKRKAAQYKDAIATDNLYDPNARIQDTSFEQDYNVPYYLDEFQPEGLALIDTTNLYDEFPEEETETILDEAKRINDALRDSIDKTDLDEMRLKLNRARWKRNPPWPAM